MTRALIGTDLDQVPLNRHLNDLARMSFDELVILVTGAITQKLSTTGLGAVNDLRNTVFERGVPQDIFNTGMTTGLARAGADGVGISGFANEEYGSLIVNGQWTDSSIGPAYNRLYFRNGRMWFQAMNTATSWGAWIEVATGATAMGKSLLTAADMASALAALSITGLGVSADLRGNTYEKGTPTSVVNKGLSMGLARGGSDGLGIPAFGTTTNQYGTLLVMAGYSDLSGGPSYNRMFIRNGRMWIQPYSSNTAWGTWTEIGASSGSGMKTFESAQLTVSLSSTLTVAHGLGVAPKGVSAYIVFTATVNQFVAGDRLEVPASLTCFYDSARDLVRPLNIGAVYWDETNLYVNLAPVWRLPYKGAPSNNFTDVSNSIANFNLVMRAFA